MAGSGKGSGHDAGQNGYLTVAVAAVVLQGKRGLRKAQWLKMYDREEDRFFAVRPFLICVKSEDLAERLQAIFGTIPEKMAKDGIAYVGELSFESPGDAGSAVTF